MEKVDFSQAVIVRSHEVPVLVDFWAPWCGPCRVLGPVIESLAEEADGKWELVKINSDMEPAVSQEYGIQSIPAVKMFHQGKVIADFVGALPRQQILQWLEKHLPNEYAATFEELLPQLQGPGREVALARLAQLVTDAPDFLDARLQLAFEYAIEAPDQALDLITGIQFRESAQIERVADIREMARLMEDDLDIQVMVGKKLLAAREAAQVKDWDQLLELLVEAVMIDKSYADDLPRKATIAWFHFLGAQHPLTLKYRRRFDMALY